MQLTNLFTIVAMAIFGVSANPTPPNHAPAPPARPQPPVINHQIVSLPHVPLGLTVSDRQLIHYRTLAPVEPLIAALPLQWVVQQRVPLVF